MARACNNGWDFVKQGMVLQYKEDHYIAIVEILEDNSTAEAYRFKVKALAASESILDEWNVSATKGQTGTYNGAVQFFANPEYVLLPLGTEWVYHCKGFHELKTDALAWDAVESGLKTFEVRTNDRDYQVGHYIRSRKTKHTGLEMKAGAPLEFIGGEHLLKVTYCFYGPWYNDLAEGSVIMSVKRLF